MRYLAGLLILAGLVAGCTTTTRSRLQAQNAYLSGQNSALQQQLAQYNGVTLVGAVKFPQVPWVAGLTLAQAIATANYVGEHDPVAVVITRQGEQAVLEAAAIFGPASIPLEPGDVVELR
ncbi:MAG TPA: hypothetical protein VF607_12945 [Verrucomicrobiae bacterium]